MGERRILAGSASEQSSIAKPPPVGRPVRVLHVITRMILGGAQENTLLTVAGLNQMPRYEVTLVSGDERGREGELLGQAAAAARLVLLPELCRSVNPVADAAALYKLVRLMRRGGFDVVHTHSSKAGILGRVAAGIARTPVVVHTIHGLPFHRYQSRAVRGLWKFVERRVASCTDHYISVADTIIQEATAAKLAPPARFTTIHSGMELDWFLAPKHDPLAIRRELGLPLEAPVLGNIARLFPLKGHDQLLDAWPGVVASQPRARLLLVGDGVLREALRERARRLGVLDTIVFAGRVTRERIPQMISAMDVLVHTSLHEGLPRVLPQALAMGKPCVAVALDGSPEVVSEGINGFLVEPGDSAALTSALARLLGDPELRIQLGRAGRVGISSDFRADRMVERIAGLYERLLSTR